MSLTDEYKNQSTWRSWDTYMEKLPVEENDVILDLGCGIGIVTDKLSCLGGRVIGIDKNPDLLDEAKRNHSRSNTEYILHDLNDIHSLNLPVADGIWTSFVVSYFPDLNPALINWLKLLRPGGWLAIVEMSGLFDHSPISEEFKVIFRDYYKKQRKENVYDFEMGSRLKNILEECGLSVIHEENMYDPELAFSGPAAPAILKSWSDRFDRMSLFRQHIGTEQYDELKSGFLECLASNDHSSETVVKFIIARK